MYVRVRCTTIQRSDHVYSRLQSVSFLRHCSTTTLSSSSSSQKQSSKSFSSKTNFKLSPGQVNETNVPSAKEITEMIPSTQELNKQLPTARELEEKYLESKPNVSKEWTSVGDAAATSPPEDGAASSGHAAAKASIFVKTTDPLEDLMNPISPEGTEKPKPSAQHVLLAYRALLWGTVYAVIGFVVTVVTAMYLCGFRNVAELRQGVRDKVIRDEAQLRQRAEQEAIAEGGTVVAHYVVDLTNPAVALQQMRDAWANIQELAEEEAARNENVANK